MSNVAGKDKEEKAKAPQSPQGADKTAKEPEKVPDVVAKSEPVDDTITFTSVRTETIIYVAQPQTVKDGDLSYRRPGMKVQFENGLYRISPSRVFSGGAGLGKIEITGKQVIAAIRQSSFFGVDVFESIPATEVAGGVAATLLAFKGKAEDELRAELRRRGLPVEAKDTRSDMLIRILDSEATLKEEDNKE